MAGLLALMAGAAQASTIATLPVSQAGDSFMFNSATGQLSSLSLGANPGVEGTQTLLPGLTPGSTASDNAPAFFSFGPITEITPVVNGAADFSGGSFAIIGSDAAYTTTGPTLLTGTFGPSELVGFGTGATLINFENATYTGGSDLAAFLKANGGTSAVGTFTVNMTGISPGIPYFLNAPSFPSFHAQGSTATFDAHSVAVPESGTTALLLGGLGLLAVTLGARKSRRITA